MAIQYQPQGYGQAVESAAISAGQAQAAAKTLEIVQEMADRDRQRRFEIEMANIKDQSALELEKRRRMWEIEKMETTSRIDFAEEERVRQKKKAQFNLDMESLDKAVKDGLITAEQGRQRKDLLTAKAMGIETEVAQLQKPLTESQQMAQIRGKYSKEAGPQPGTGTVAKTPPAAKMVWQSMATPQGVLIQNPITQEVEPVDPTQIYQIVADDGTNLTMNGSKIIQIKSTSDAPLNITGKVDPNTIQGNAVAMAVQAQSKPISAGPYSSIGQAPTTEQKEFVANLPGRLSRMVTGEPSDEELRKKYQLYVKKVGIKKETLTYSQWKKQAQEQYSRIGYIGD